MGPLAIDEVTAAPAEAGVKTLAEATLAVVLFADASRIKPRVLRREDAVPLRLLEVGLSLTMRPIALAAADVEDKAASGSHAIVAGRNGYGILQGAAGLAAAVVVVLAYRRDLVSGLWLQVIPVAGAGLAYGIAVSLAGSGFIAAFLAGPIFAALVPAESEQASRPNEERGGATFLIIGAVLLGPALERVSWQIAIYAVLSLTLVRMLPVAVAMIATEARMPTVGFLGWFGPRGLASIVFAVIVVEEAHLPGAATILPPLI